MKIAALIPASPFEPERTLLRSANHLLKISKDLDIEIVYVLDDGKMKEALKDLPVRVICRGTSRGKRAGALNDALREISADFIAIFDVDSLPEEGFIEKCIEALERDESVAVVSGCRKILNEKFSFVTRIVSSEYFFFCDMYRLMNHFGAFIHFNGLIGVLRASALSGKEFNENVLCEDVEMMNRLILEGHRTKFIPAVIREEAPMTLRDLVNQRIRWSAGAIESLQLFSKKILESPLPLSFKLSWFITMLSPFYSFLLSFLVPLYSWRLIQISDGIKDFLVRFLGLFVYGWIISFCAFSTLLKKFLGRKIEWAPIERV